MGKKTKTETTSDAGEMLRGECLTAVRHDGVLYAPGDIIEVPRAAMERLVEAEAVELLFDVAPTPEETSAGDVAPTPEKTEA